METFTLKEKYITRIKCMMFLSSFRD